MEPETKNGCAGEDQQQFTGLDWTTKRTCKEDISG
jgi:hypothetical protein